MFRARSPGRPPAWPRADADRGQAGSRRAIPARVAVAVSMLLLGTLPWADSAGAQVRDGVTVTVLRGSVAVIHADHSGVQPAPSGIMVRPGEEVRTLPDSGATLTFFSGTEVELGEMTTLVVERVRGDDGRIDVSLRQVFGASLHRVHSLTSSGDRYQVDVGGAVAVVRGTEFLLYGPTDENVVGIACLDDCDGRTTFAGCPVSPNAGFWVEVARGQVVSPCQPFAPSGNPWNAPGELRIRDRGT